jgi:hypothetical protein
MRRMPLLLAALGNLWTTPLAGQAAPPDSTSEGAAVQSAQHVRTAIELGGVYGVVVLLYYFDGRHRHLDRPQGGFGNILSPSRLRLDDNIFDMNNIAHPLGGLVYYGIPRANGASAGRSFATLLAASVFWEQVVEFQEIAAINDHIATPISGWALGEALFQNRSFFQQSAPTLTNRALAALFGVPVAASEILRPRAGGPARGRDRNTDPPAPAEGRFRFHAGLGNYRGDELLGTGTRIQLGLESEVQTVGVRTAPGDRDGWFGSIASTRLDLGFALQDGHVSELRALARVVPAGWYTHRVNGSDAAPAGHSLLLGDGRGPFDDVALP